MTNTEIQFGIKSLRESTFWIRKIPQIFHPEINPTLLKYNIDFKVSLVEADNLITIHTTITGFYDDVDFLQTKVWPNIKNAKKEDIVKLLYLEYHVLFHFAPLSAYLQEVDGEKHLDAVVLALVIDNTISMARGHIGAKTEGTIFAENPLPYFTPDTVIQRK